MESSKLIDQQLEILISSELEENYNELKNNPTRLSDAIKCLFSFWSLSYSSVVMLYAPLNIPKPEITFVNNCIKIIISFFNTKIDAQLFKLEVAGRAKGRPTRLFLTINEFNKSDTIIYRKFHFSNPTLEDTLRIKLYYKGDLLYETEVEKVNS